MAAVLHAWQILAVTWCFEVHESRQQASHMKSVVTQLESLVRELFNSFKPA